MCNDNNDYNNDNKNDNNNSDDNNVKHLGFVCKQFSS